MHGKKSPKAPCYHGRRPPEKSLQRARINQALGLTIYCSNRLADQSRRRRSSIMTVGVASRVRILTTVALAAIALAGCKTIGTTDTTGSISSSNRNDADWRRDAEGLGDKFRANPRDADNAIRYAQALRATGQRTQAAA